MECLEVATCIDVALRVTNADFLTTHSPPPGTMPPHGRNPAERRGEPQNQILRSWFDSSFFGETINLSYLFLHKGVPQSVEGPGREEAPEPLSRQGTEAQPLQGQGASSPRQQIAAWRKVRQIDIY